VLGDSGLGTVATLNITIMKHLQQESSWLTKQLRIYEGKPCITA